jgi:hypothetical protein
LVRLQIPQWNQNWSLAPNWIWREVVEVAETRPAVGETPDVADV